MKIFFIGINTFREAIRDKVLYNLVFFAILMIGASSLLGKLSIGEQVKIIKDMGLASTSLFGVLIAVFVGVGLVYKELEKRTIYTIISKPIHRHEFILGKFLGLTFVLLVNIVIISASLILMLFLMTGEFEVRLLLAVLPIFFELFTITALAMLFSTFSTPFLSSIFTLAFFIIGHLGMDIKTLGAKGTPLVKFITSGLYYLLPNLDNLDIKERVIYGLPVGVKFLSLSILHAIVYMTAVLFLAIIIFQKRDFK
jgi:ABC-type transport system involved in multi-copper enzyme maturation permease subunit